MRALPALFFALASVAHAQELPTLEGQASSITTSGVPDHAMFTAHNPTRAPVRLTIGVIHYGTIDGIPLPIFATDANDRPSTGSITIPPGGTVHLVLCFHGIPLADRTQAQFTLTLQATLAGRAVTASTTVSRAIRDALRNITITS
jgi:hypothetical protein